MNMNNNISTPIFVEDTSIMKELIFSINQLSQVNNSKKRWLNINEAANYIGYTTDGLRQLLHMYLSQYVRLHYKVLVWSINTRFKSFQLNYMRG